MISQLERELGRFFGGSVRVAKTRTPTRRRRTVVDIDGKTYPVREIRNGRRKMFSLEIDGEKYESSVMKDIRVFVYADYPQADFRYEYTTR